MIVSGPRAAALAACEQLQADVALVAFGACQRERPRGAVGGGWGTLSEIALALKTGRSVVGVGSWELARDGQAVEGIVAMDIAEEAVAAALARVS